MPRHCALEAGVPELGEDALGDVLPREPLGPAARQPLKRGTVELPEDLRLPARHDAGPDRAHVGKGQQVELAESFGGAAERGQRLDRLGIVDVTTLGDVRERDVLGDQEDHGARGSLPC